MAVTVTPSTRYQQWMRQLRVSWMGRKAQDIMGALAQVLGDYSYDWLLRANLEHLPEYAISPISVGLTASERQLDAGPAEAQGALASRTVNAAPLWRFAGTPLGTLLALYYAGFPNAVLVTQNGQAFSLSLPLPQFVPGVKWDPTPNLVVTAEATIATALTSSVTPPTANTAGRSIPAGNSWWVFDNNTDFCSRFAILFPGPLPGAFTTYATVPFTASNTGTATWNNAFADTTYKVRVMSVTTTDGGGTVAVSPDGTTQTTTGIGLVASAPFTGFADVIAYQSGACPYADLHPADLARLRTVIAKWRPGKASCVGIYAVAQGSMFGWPVATWGTRTTTGPATIVSYAGA